MTIPEKTVKGRLLHGVGGLYTVLTADGETVVCRAKGALHRDENRAMIGDAVRVRFSEAPDSAVIAEIFPRKNALIRPPIANTDTVFVTAAVTHPAPVTETLDKLTAILVHNGISPVMVFTKAELSESAANTLRKTYEKAGFPVFLTSAVENRGIAELRAYVESALAGGRIAAIAGASGVGKSTLLNALFPELSLETGEISRKIERGKHTTREVSLFPLAGGFLADTPGFSMLDFTRFDFMELTDLIPAFPEMRDCAYPCRYADCTHTKEEECGIREAVRRGEIPTSRFDSYLSIYEAVKKRDPYA